MFFSTASREVPVGSGAAPRHEQEMCGYRPGRNISTQFFQGNSFICHRRGGGGGGGLTHSFTTRGSIVLGVVGDMNKKCVVIDLDETLVHSSFKVTHSFATKGV